MEQGKIDMILSSRAEDRRYIFEEAAGISRFKYQKKESLRKLEEIRLTRDPYPHNYERTHTSAELHRRSLLNTRV